MYNTFNGWKRQGRVVVMGERAHSYNMYGDGMYHICQTTSRGNPAMFNPSPRRIRAVTTYNTFYI